MHFRRVKKHFEKHISKKDGKDKKPEVEELKEHEVKFLPKKSDLWQPRKTKAELLKESADKMKKQRSWTRTRRPSPRRQRRRRSSSSTRWRDRSDISSTRSSRSDKEEKIAEV